MKIPKKKIINSLEIKSFKLKSKLDTSKIVENPKYINDLHFNIADFNDITPEKLVEKSILPGEEMSKFNLQDRMKSAVDQIGRIYNKIDLKKQLSKQDFKNIKDGKQLVKDYYKSDRWADKARKANLTEEEINATSKFLCDNIDRTIIVANPLRSNIPYEGTSFSGRGMSYPIPIIAYKDNPTFNVIVHELLHSSEFNGITSSKDILYPQYYKNINPNVLSGLEKMKSVESHVSCKAYKGFKEKYKQYLNLSEFSSDLDALKNKILLHIIQPTEIRAYNITKDILDNAGGSDKYGKIEDISKFFTKETNNYINSNLFVSIPAVGILGKSVYDMLGNNQSNDQNIQY